MFGQRLSNYSSVEEEARKAYIGKLFEERNVSEKKRFSA